MVSASNVDSASSLSWKGFKYVARAPKVIFDYSMVIMILAVVALFILSLVSWALMLYQDFNAAHGQATDQHEANRLRCRDEYFTNECEPDKRREYLEDYCREREECMNTGSHTAVKNISVGSNLIAQALNSFFGQMEQRALLIFVLCLCLGAWVLSKYV